MTEEGFDLSRPGYALATLLAVPLLCTALSARRWAGYEPAQVPLLGTVGRARGTVAAPGTSVAAARTAVIPTAPGVPAGVPVGAPIGGAGDVPTEAVPTQPVPVTGGDEPTMITVPVSEGGPAEGDEPTVIAAAGDGGVGDVEDEPTVADFRRGRPRRERRQRETSRRRSSWWTRPAKRRRP